MPQWHPLSGFTVRMPFFFCLSSGKIFKKPATATWNVHGVPRYELWQRFTHKTQLQNVVTGKRQFRAWRCDHAGIHIHVCGQRVPRESYLELGEQELKEARADSVPVGFTKAYVIRYLPSPFFALEVSSCDHPMTHGRAGSVLLMLSSPRAPNCRLKLMVFGPRCLVTHSLRPLPLFS